MRNNGAVLPVAELQQGYADTWDIGGSRWPFYSADAFDPNAYVGTTTVVPLSVLSAPPTYGQLDAAAGAYGTSGQAQNIAQQYPWDPRNSPLVPIILAVIVGLWGFHYLYYKERRRR